MDENNENDKKYSGFPEVEVLRDKKGDPYAYRAGGITSTSPPMAVGKHFVIF
jgi:hypothetical protein